jgi:serine/threonine-protein kinase
MLDPGSEIAGYRIEGVLGRGGMGRVYEAVQLSLQRTIALKILRDDLGMDEAFRARFRREGRVQGGLAHPHIVTVHEAGEADGHLFIAMQLVRGPTLKRMIAAGELDAERAIALLRQVADALDAAHETGLTHRDVKPQNVLVGRGSHAYLADFGLTKTLSDSGDYTRSGQFVGTIDYVSPEQIRGEVATPASDVYALGAMLYESLAGQVPYPRDTEVAVLYAHLGGELPRLSAVRDDLPADLDDVIARAMDKDPAQRPTTAGSLIEQAYAALAARGPSSGAFRAPPPTPLLSGGGAPAIPEIAEDFPPTMTPGSRLIPPESDPSFAIPDHLPAEPEREDVAAERAGGHVAERADVARVAAEPEGVAAVERTGEEAEAARAAVERASGVAERASGVAERASGVAKRADVAAARAAAAATAARRRKVRLPVLGVVVAVGIAATGVVVGKAGGGHAPAGAGPVPRSRVATNAALVTRYPSSWTQAATTSVGKALHLARPIALTTPAGGGASFVAGLASGAVAPSLITTATATTTTLPKPERVRVGALSAYRYDGVRLRGVSGPVVVLVAPTTAGVVTLACAGSQTAGCSAMAAATTLRDGKPLALGADPAYAKKLRQGMARLNAERSASRKRLAAAAGPKRQAQAATAAATAFRHVGTTLQGLAPGPADAVVREALLTHATRVAEAYTKLASAARREDHGAYATAAAAVRRRELAFGRDLTRLRAAGYRVG